MENRSDHNLTAADIGLAHLNYQTLATAESGVGIYQVAATMDALI